MRETLRLGVLASGSGTDLQSIIDASEKGMIDAKVIVVISDNEKAYALKRAEKHNIKSILIKPQNKTCAEHEKEIEKYLLKNNIELVVGAGYMRVLSPSFVKKWYGKLINIHPALLPSFKGTDGQGDALDYGVKISGCSTHFMDEDMDHGPIILQAAVRVHQDDDRASLTARILEIEHQILPRTIQLYAEKRLYIKGRKVIIQKGKSWVGKYNTIPDVLYPKDF